MGNGKKEKEGYSPAKLANWRLPFQLPYMNPATNWGSSLWCSDSEMRRYQERHTHLQLHKGAGGEATEDKDQDIIYEDVYFIPLVGGLLLHLD